MDRKPSILFIFSDQQHWQAAGFQDGSFQTPNLDRLAAESVVFTQAFCTTPQCSPSRSSIMTGLYPSKTGVLGNVGMAGGEALRTPTVGAMLKSAGYRTAYFGKWHLGKDAVGTSGWDEDLGVTGPELRDDTEVTRRALDFLSRNAEGEQPFALFLSYNNPHDICRFKRGRPRTPDRGGTVEAVPSGAVTHKDPLTLPESWYRKDLSTVPSVQRQFMEEDKGKFMLGAEPPVWLRYREFYRRKVQLYDQEVGRVLDAMDDRGLFQNTLVVATSDHGDMDGHQGLVRKGPFMYEHLMRVPLMIRLPGSPQARGRAERDFLCVNVDLTPTLLDFAGDPAGHLQRARVDPLLASGKAHGGGSVRCGHAPGAGVSGFDGVSLRPLLTAQGDPPRRQTVIGQYYSKQQWVNPIRMIRTRKYKYNLYRVHGEELYDLENDPLELHNVADDPRYAQAKARLAGALERWMRQHADPFHAQHPTTRSGEPLPGTGAHGRGST